MLSNVSTPFPLIVNPIIHDNAVITIKSTIFITDNTNIGNAPIRPSKKFIVLLTFSFVDPEPDAVFANDFTYRDIKRNANIDIIITILICIFLFLLIFIFLIIFILAPFSI